MSKVGKFEGGWTMQKQEWYTVIAVKYSMDNKSTLLGYIIGLENAHDFAELMKKRYEIVIVVRGKV